MDYKAKIFEILKANMTEKGLKLFRGITKLLPDAWNKPTSSTGKYHKKKNGDVPTQAEHVYHMLYSAVKLFRMFNINKNTTDADKMLLAIALHDTLKYGTLGNRKHTDKQHDRAAADMIAQNKNTFMKILTKEQFFVLEEMVRFHSGQWSTDIVKEHPFSFKNYNPETMMIHMLDMMSTADLIQTDVRD